MFKTHTHRQTSPTELLKQASAPSQHTAEQGHSHSPSQSCAALEAGGSPQPLGEKGKHSYSQHKTPLPALGQLLPWGQSGFRTKTNPAQGP